jgi:hypothetical protein
VAWPRGSVPGIRHAAPVLAFLRFYRTFPNSASICLPRLGRWKRERLTRHGDAGVCVDSNGSSVSASESGERVTLDTDTALFAPGRTRPVPRSVSVCVVLLWFCAGASRPRALVAPAVTSSSARRGLQPPTGPTRVEVGCPPHDEPSVGLGSRPTAALLGFVQELVRANPLFFVWKSSIVQMRTCRTISSQIALATLFFNYSHFELQL